MIFAGLVIGGPLNGQRMAHGEAWIDVATCAGDHLGPTARYEWKPIYISAQGEQLNVWAPKDATRLDTLKLLLEGYKP